MQIKYILLVIFGPLIMPLSVFSQRNYFTKFKQDTLRVPQLQSQSLIGVELSNAIIYLNRSEFEKKLQKDLGDYKFVIHRESREKALGDTIRVNKYLQIVAKIDSVRALLKFDQSDTVYVSYGRFLDSSEI